MRDPITEFALDDREAELFRAVVEAPGDDEPRVAYADYMKEVDPDREELIRLQLGQREVWRRHGTDFDVPEWDDRVQALLSANATKWARGIETIVSASPEYGWGTYFCGGMVEQLKISHNEYLDKQTEILAVAPVRFLLFGSVAWQENHNLSRLIDAGLPQQIVGVSFGELSVEEVSAMANSERFANVRAVWVGRLRDRRAAFDAVATSRYWRGLLELTIRGGELEEDHDYWGYSRTDLGDSLAEKYGDLPWLSALKRYGSHAMSVL